MTDLKYGNDGRPKVAVFYSGASSRNYIYQNAFAKSTHFVEMRHYIKI